MLVMEYGGPLYDVDISPSEAWATDTNTDEKYQVMEFQQDNKLQEVTMKFFMGKTVVGRRLKLDPQTIDLKLEESLWDE